MSRGRPSVKFLPSQKWTACPDKSITRISSSVSPILRGKISLFAEFLCSSPGINTLATLIGRKIGALSPERRFDRLVGGHKYRPVFLDIMCLANVK